MALGDFVKRTNENLVAIVPAASFHAANTDRDTLCLSFSESDVAKAEEVVVTFGKAIL